MLLEPKNNKMSTFFSGIEVFVLGEGKAQLVLTVDF
jgi:hypothetical protein